MPLSGSGAIYGYLDRKCRPTCAVACVSSTLTLFEMTLAGSTPVRGPRFCETMKNIILAILGRCWLWHPWEPWGDTKTHKMKTTPLFGSPITDYIAIFQYRTCRTCRKVQERRVD